MPAACSGRGTGGFDLDHFRAEIAQDERRYGAGDGVGEVDDADAGERLPARRGRVRQLRRTTGGLSEDFRGVLAEGWRGGVAPGRGAHAHGRAGLRDRPGAGMVDGDEAGAFAVVGLGHHLARFEDLGEGEPERLGLLDDVAARLVGEPLVHDGVDLVGVAHHGVEQIRIEQPGVGD